MMSALRLPTGSVRLGIEYEENLLLSCSHVERNFGNEGYTKTLFYTKKTQKFCSSSIEWLLKFIDYYEWIIEI